MRLLPVPAMAMLLLAVSSCTSSTATTPASVQGELVEARFGPEETGMQRSSYQIKYKTRNSAATEQRLAGCAGLSGAHPGYRTSSTPPVQSVDFYGQPPQQRRLEQCLVAQAGQEARLLERGTHRVLTLSSILEVDPHGVPADVLPD